MANQKNDITICEKPEWIGFQDILNLLLEAHAHNPDVSFKTSGLTLEEWNGRLESGGTVIVALAGRELVGSITVSVESSNRRYARGKVARCRYVAVSPRYMRRHIASGMIDACVEWAKKNDIPILLWTTAANNEAAIRLCHNNDFQKVDYLWYKNEDHPSVAMMRWIDHEHPPKLLLLANYCKNKMRVRREHGAQ